MQCARPEIALGFPGLTGGPFPDADPGGPRRTRGARASAGDGWRGGAR
ncbi:hypothetical protein FAGKG844_230020 [Frankia sp. AgKG'84/4]